jgi:Icc protein
LVQVTDTHLTGTETGRLLGMNTARSARCVIDAALATESADCILVTGDIAADGQPEAYGQLEALLGTSVPSLWLPGNHDDVSSHKDRYAPHMKRCLRAKHWNVVMLETQVEGEVGGVLSTTELAALRSAVDDARRANKALLVATHHPLRRLESAWLDEQSVKNASEALDILKSIADQTAVISGHVHQESDEVINGVRMMTTPSTCVQFAPRSQDFALDSKDPGYRRLVLHANARIETQVVRISDEENRPLQTSSGYH